MKYKVVEANNILFVDAIPIDMNGRRHADMILGEHL